MSGQVPDWTSESVPVHVPPHAGPGHSSHCVTTGPGHRKERQPEKFRQLPNSWSCGVVVITSALHADGPRFDPGRDQ